VDKQLLLVLDNCEHLAAECAALVAKLLAASGGVRVLATSRHTLFLEGERVLQVEPLTVPSVHDMGAGPSEAVMLFAERASSAGRYAAGATGWHPRPLAFRCAAGAGPAGCAARSWPRSPASLPTT
jgi:hypothetical protein